MDAAQARHMDTVARGRRHPPPRARKRFTVLSFIEAKSQEPSRGRWADEMSVVPPYVCPLQSTSTSETPFLGVQELTYYLSPLQLSLACT